MRTMETQRLITVLIAVAMIGALSGSSQAQVPVTSGLRLWLDAQDLDGDGVAEGLGESGLSGIAVTSWGDKAGTADNATQGNVAKQPIYLTSGFGGASLPSVLFDGVFGTGSGDSLDAGTGLNITGNGLTVFALVRQMVNSGGVQHRGNGPGKL